MKFLVQKKSKTDLKYSLVYREEDYSFDIEPLICNGYTSIMINDLQLEIDDEGKIVYVWGLCPLIKYQETDMVPKNYESANLVALLNKSPIPGISYRLNENERWPIYINKQKGWVCIGNPDSIGEKNIEFLHDCIAVLEKQEIVAIWLKPQKLPQPPDMC